MKNKVIVFDIDGTVANNNHRVHWVKNKPKNWAAYNAKMLLDQRYDDIFHLYQLFCVDPNNILIFCSGREAVFYKETTEWLEKNEFVNYKELYMRPQKDYRSDDIVKVELLRHIENDWGKPFLWFDDRERVVNAIRREGVRVLQVSEGKF